MRRYITMLMIAALAAGCTDRGEAAHNGEAAHDGDQLALTQEAGERTTVAAGDPGAGDTMEVWKDANCGCCKNWIEHVEKAGFTVIAHDTPNLTPIKQKHGVGADLTSCHTATIAGYTIEGHVPADLIRRMLDEKPAIDGLAVPGMPMGSPGMEGAISQEYDVIAFGRDGSRSVYASR